MRFFQLSNVTPNEKSKFARVLNKDRFLQFLEKPVRIVREIFVQFNEIVSFFSTEILFLSNGITSKYFIAFPVR